MSSKRLNVVPLLPEEALDRMQGPSEIPSGILVTPSSEFYSPPDLDAQQRSALRAVQVERSRDELKLVPPPANEERHIDLEYQVWLLAHAARTLCRLGLDVTLSCHLELGDADDPGASFHVSNIHGEAVDLSQPILLDELRGLTATREWAEAPRRASEPKHEEFVSKVVSEEEALQIIRGERAGLGVALSTRGRWAAVSQTVPATPFHAHIHLAEVWPTGGLSHEQVSLLIEIPVAGEIDSLAWRLRSVAERLIGVGAPVSARCMIHVEPGETLLNPLNRIRDEAERNFEPTKTYRLREVRGFRDADDLPSLKRPPEERIADTQPIVYGDYTLDEALAEAARCVECGLCRDICPNAVGLATYIDKLKLNEVDAAATELRELNPGVDMTCQVCPAPCQDLCLLTQEEIPQRPVNIRGIEQVLAHRPVSTPRVSPASTGYKVALVGLGPANLVAATRLAKRGHEVHVFERQQEFGGAVSLIPSFRMYHANTRQWTQQLLQETGVKIHTGMSLGHNLEFEDLRNSHDAVILGIGAGKPMSLGIEGGELTGVVDALQVLREFNRQAAGEQVDDPPPKLRNTIVIGGGDVAADVVRWYIRVAYRCARQIFETDGEGTLTTPEVANVVWAYRRGRSQMPVSREILRDTEDELDALREFQVRGGMETAEGELPSGVYFHLRPTKVLGQAGNVIGMQFIRTRPGKERDRSGRLVVEDVPGSKFTIPADSIVVLAIGQTPDPIPLKHIPGLSLDKSGRVLVDPSTMKAADGIYAVGDLIGGEILADAISHGRRSADSIHQDYLSTLSTTHA